MFIRYHRVADGPILRRLIVRFSVAAALLLLAFAAAEQLRQPIGRLTFLPVFPVIVYVTAAWGARSGLLATTLGTTGMALLMEPRWTLFIGNAADRRVTIAFICVSVVTVWLANRDYRLRHSLRRSEAEFRAFFELAAVGSAKVDARSGQILQANQQMSVITGYARGELLEKTIAHITHQDDRDRDRRTYLEVMAGYRTQWATEKRYVRKDGSVVWVLVNGTIVRGIDGEPDHFIAHAIDISHRRIAEEEARRVNQLKDEFLATLSHELRTPLNVLAGWVHLLTKRSSPDDLRRSLPVIKRNVEALRHLTDDLLGLADVLAGKVGLQRETINVSALVAEVVDSLSLAADHKGVAVKPHWGTDVLVHGDERRLRQVFWNLLSNALKFTPEGGGVTIRVRLEAQHAVIEVADTGIGITASFLPHVFEKFRQEDGTQTREHSGLGVGLAVARQFTELHGGTITVQSPGRHQGSVFAVRLPAVQAAYQVAEEQKREEIA